jgi:hypothetical protein
MVAFDLMQIGDIPLNDQHVNVPPYPVHNSRPTVNVARLPYRKENITEAFVTEDRKHYLGPMNYACIHCGALKFLLEQSSLCCNEGSIDLPRVTWPVQYRALFATRDEYSKDFLKNVRMYNSAFAMVSTACKLDPRVNNRGIPTYRVQGSIHHYIGGILPDDGATQNFAQVRNIINTQIYFNDEEAGFNRRRGIFAGLKMETHSFILGILRAHNPYVGAFKAAYELLAGNHAIDEFRIVFDTGNTREFHQRVVNAPMTNEVAAIVAGNFTDPDFGKRCLAVPLRNGGPLKIVNQLSSCADPLSYPLLFPNGEAGWSRFLIGTDGKKITMQKFARYRLMVRQNPTIHLGERLFQQYVTDVGVKIEEDRLNFLSSKEGQKKVRFKANQ